MNKDQFAYLNETIIQLEAENARLRLALEQAGNELGIPQPGYPMPVANAANIIRHALEGR